MIDDFSFWILLAVIIITDLVILLLVRNLEKKLQEVLKR